MIEEVNKLDTIIMELVLRLKQQHESFHELFIKYCKQTGHKEMEHPEDCEVCKLISKYIKE